MRIPDVVHHDQQNRNPAHQINFQNCAKNPNFSLAGS